MDIKLGMVREDILTTYFGSVFDLAQQVEKPIHPPKEVVNQNGDINEWKRRGTFLLICTTPVMPVDTTQIN